MSEHCSDSKEGGNIGTGKRKRTSDDFKGENKEGNSMDENKGGGKESTDCCLLLHKLYFGVTVTIMAGIQSNSAPANICYEMITH